MYENCQPPDIKIRMGSGFFKSEFQPKKVKSKSKKIFVTNVNEAKSQQKNTDKIKSISDVVKRCFSTLETFKQSLEHIMKFQQSLAEISGHINVYYKFPLFFLVLDCFISITFNLYFVSLCLFNPSNKFQTARTDTIWFLVQNLFDPVLILINLVYHFESIVKTFRKMEKVIVRQILEFQDESVRKRLSEFLQQVKTNKPSFDVYDLYPLNGKLLLSMTSAITTYLIILVEYSDDSTHNPNNSTTTS